MRNYLRWLWYRLRAINARMRGVHSASHAQRPIAAKQQSTAPWTHLETPHGAIRVVAARACNEDGTYPAPPAPPPPPAISPFNNNRREPWPDGETLDYFPEKHVREHPSSWTFPSYLDNSGCQWLQTLKRLYSTPITFPSSLSPEAGLLLHSLVRNIRPKRVIETGTYLGVSTIWIAAALEENGDGGEIYTFDDFSPIEKGPYRDVEMPTGRLEFVADLLAEAGLGDRVMLYAGNSSFEIRAARGELAANGGVEMAFLDADHGVIGAEHDFWATESVLKKGGFVIFHDTFPQYCGGHEGPRHVLDHANAIGQGRYDVINLYLSPWNYGLGMLQRIG